MPTEADMVVYRVVKRLKDGMIVYDRVRRPWYSPWKEMWSRNSLAEAAFQCLTAGKVVEGSYDEEIA